MPANSLALTGLTAHLDRLCHRCDPSLPPETPHAFAYYITIRNASEHTVTLLGRKWVVEHADGTRQVTEGDKIVGETPRLAPGDTLCVHGGVYAEQLRSPRLVPGPRC